MFCPNCGSQNDDFANNCASCGAPLGNEGYHQPSYQPNNFNQVPNGNQKSKLVAGLLGIFLGGLGIHSFYLGKTTIGIVQIIVTFVTCGIGGWWGIIEGILILTGNINTDANGIPLKD